MALAVMRERFSLAARSSIVAWEPNEVADMALTLEALAGIFEVACRAPQWAPDQTPRWNAELAVALSRVKR